MARTARPIARAAGIFATLTALAAVLAGNALAQQEKPVYRYVEKDGRIVYSDRAPPGPFCSASFARFLAVMAALELVSGSIAIE